MILNGKALEHFLKWLSIQGASTPVDICNFEHTRFFNLSKVSQYALIIEWFDSVGIYINVSPNYLDHDRKYSEGDFKAVINFKDGKNTMSVDFPFESCFNPCKRQETTKQAIIKANEIYNKKE